MNISTLGRQLYIKFKLSFILYVRSPINKDITATTIHTYLNLFLGEFLSCFLSFSFDSSSTFVLKTVKENNHDTSITFIMFINCEKDKLNTKTNLKFKCFL